MSNFFTPSFVSHKRILQQIKRTSSTIACGTQARAKKTYYETTTYLSLFVENLKEKIIILPKKRSEEMINVQTKINKILLSKHIDKSLKIAILADLLQEELRNE